MTTVNKVTDYKNFISNITRAEHYRQRKITEIQVVAIDMEITQRTTTTNILVRIFTMNVLTKGPEGHATKLPAPQNC
jgi:hypothetical protein